MALCIRCCGTGRYLGNGMMMTNCTLCDEHGHMISSKEEKVAYKSAANSSLDKRTNSYKNAIKELMNTDQKLTKKEAEKLFENAYNKGE
jgi:hypothetical protein